MSRRHPPEQCGGTDDSETRHCSPVSFLSRTCHTVIAMALPLSVLAFCLELPLLTPRMSTMIMVSFLHCTAHGRYASNMCVPGRSLGKPSPKTLCGRGSAPSWAST